MSRRVPEAAPARLGSPLRVGRLELRNRVVSPPMERNYGTADGRVTDRYRAYLRARAAGGAALVFTEATYVRADGRGRARQLGAHADHVVTGLAALADAVHAEGARLGVELNHAGRVADPAVSGFQPVAPSVVPFRGRPPRELATGEVEELVTAFEAAAGRCATAGVDVLELHAAHGYLVHQFLSPRTNSRTDRYADPVLFLTEVLAGIRRAAPDTTVFLRLSAFEGVPGGLDASATLELTGRMPLDLVDALDISAGCYEAGEWIVQPGEVDRGVLAPYAAPFRRFGKPVCVAGRIPTGEAAERILGSGAADLVAVGRAQHADPAWTNVTLAGGLPRPCIGCNQGCIDVLHTQQPIWCLTNPATGREGGSPAEGLSGPVIGSGGLSGPGAGSGGLSGSAAGSAALSGPGVRSAGVLPAPRMTRLIVLVVGAGLAGLEAARTAARAGHAVTVLEAGAEIGGQFRLAALLPAKPEFGRLLAWYAAELAGLGVDLRLGTVADAGTVAATAPNVVVLAAGGTAFRPPIAGIGRPRVIDVCDWLERPRPVDRNTVVTVWGADRAGVAVADAAATAGHRVLLIGGGRELAPEAGPREKGLPVRRLTTGPDVEIRLDSTLEAIDGDRLLIGRAGHREWTGVAGPVIVSQGTVPRTIRPLPGSHRTVVLETAADAADAIRQGAAVSL